MIFAALLLGYLLGSIPTGYLLARSRGVDIRQHGSGNIGATNVFRILGKGLGICAFIGDTAKGVLAVVLAGWLASLSGSALPPSLFTVGAGLACILGHNYTIWLGFKGGKGIATSAGVIVALMPLAVPILLVVWIVVFATTRYVSLASITAACLLPLTVFLLGFWIPTYDNVVLCFALIAAGLAVWRHRSNITRLRDGTENRFGRKSTT